MERGELAPRGDVDGAVALEVPHTLNGDDGLDGGGRALGRGLHGAEVGVEPRIAVHDEDPVASASRQRLLDGAAGEEGLLLGAVHHVHAAVGAAEEPLDLFPAVTVGDDGALDAGRGQLVHDEAQERPAGDGRHGLADVGHDVGEPRAEAACEDYRLPVPAHYSAASPNMSASTAAHSAW